MTKGETYLRRLGWLSLQVRFVGLLLLLLFTSCQGEQVDAALRRERVSVHRALGQSLASGTTLGDVQDALARSARLAAEFKRLHPEQADYLERVGRARSLSEHLLRAAQEWAPVTDAELSEFTRRHWWQLDRPTSVRTIHIVVQLPEEDRSRQSLMEARQFAETLQARLADAADKEDFRSRLEDVTDDPRVKIEELPPVTADGRVIDLDQPPPPGARPSRFDTAFAAAAAVLSLGEVSDVVKSSFGFHVILATEVIPSRKLPAGERRELLAPEVFNSRASQLQREILKQARARYGVEVALQAISFTGQIEVVE